MNNLYLNSAAVDQSTTSAATTAPSTAPQKTEDIKESKLSNVVSLPEEKSQEKKEPKTEKLVEALNDYMDMLQTTLGFSIDDNDHDVIITVKNRETDEIVRQIPSEELVQIQEKMEELTGLILNQKV